MFPTERTAFGSSKRWHAKLPDSLAAAWPDLATLTTSSERANSDYIWKYGYFCGSNNWVVAQFALSDTSWPYTEFNIPSWVQPNSREWDQIGQFGQVLSRIVLIHLPTGSHYDLTAKVATELGVAESASHTGRVLGVYPTCSEPEETIPAYTGGATLNLPLPAGFGV